MASRSLGYGRSASIAVCTTAMTSPASAPIMVKPRIRSSLPATRAFMNPCVSSVVSVRRTALVGSLYIGERLGSLEVRNARYLRVRSDVEEHLVAHEYARPAAIQAHLERSRRHKTSRPHDQFGP